MSRTSNSIAPSRAPILTLEHKRSLLAALAALSQNYVYPADAALATRHLQEVLNSHVEVEFESEVWFEIETQPKGATDEWVNSGYGQFDNEKALNKALDEITRGATQAFRKPLPFEFRGIRVTNIRQVMPATAPRKQLVPLTKAEWIERYGGQAVLDREGMAVIPCTPDCDDNLRRLKPMPTKRRSTVTTGMVTTA